ncbi:alpha-1,2-fucosyltransferase [Streptococcus hongkongensis]|nr:hypothetical protein NC01_08270 [Streptococcus uberis]
MKKVIYNIAGTRFGNHLYFFLKASKTADVKVRYLENMDYWLDYFPKLNNLLTDSNDCKKVVMPSDFFQNYGKDFTKEDLDLFIENYLEKGLVNSHFENDCDLIINVRRGDFFTDEHKYFYGFDQIDFLKKVLQKCMANTTNSIGIVSDDIDWCKNNLSHHLNLNQFQKVIFYKTTPMEALVILSRAKSLVIMNSTFSYWGAYLNEFFNPRCTIYAPDYNTLNIRFGEMITKSKSWNIIRVKPYKRRFSKIIMRKNKILSKIRNLKK